MARRAGAPPTAAALLIRYLRMYWLKPFDAVNDAANARALLGFPWEEPVLEIGGGDGVFSFTMHGGTFVSDDDRYDQVDPSRAGDMFDVHDDEHALRVKRPAARRYQVGVDLKRSHLLKCRATGLYRHLVQAAPAPLPFRAAAFRTVFLYFPHGLIERGTTLDYAATLAEIRRVLSPDGRLLMTAMNGRVRRHFVCHAWSDRFERAGWTRAAAYCRRLDNGRYREIGGLARPLVEWRRLLDANGFDLVEASTQVSPAAWRIYDLQTRPILQLLIRASRWMRRAGLKSVVKTIWIGLWFPIVAASYTLTARPRRLSAERPSRGVVFAFTARCHPLRSEAAPIPAGARD